MWKLMLTVDLLKHGIPDPSSLFPTHFQTPSAALEKEYKDKLLAREDYMAVPVLVHTKLLNQEINPRNILPLKKALLQNFRHSSFGHRKALPDLGFVNERSIFCENGVRERMAEELSKNLGNGENLFSHCIIT